MLKHLAAEMSLSSAALRLHLRLFKCLVNALPALTLRFRGFRGTVADVRWPYTLDARAPAIALGS